MLLHAPPALPTPSADAGAADKATAKLLGAALGSSSSEGGGGDLELGPARIAAGRAPRWVAASEGIKGEMLVLRERMAKLRE